MDSSESIKALTAALVAFQGKVGPVTKTKVGKISGVSKSGKPYDYEYHYADLSDQREHVRDALTTNGLYLAQDVSSDGGSVAIQTMVAHTSGEWIKTGWLSIETDGSAQAVGSAVTYGRRYQYAGVLGLAAEEDEDGKAATERAKSTSKASGEVDTRPATENQLRKAYAMRKTLGLSQESYDRQIIEHYNKTSDVQLTRSEVADLFERLQSAIDAKASETPQDDTQAPLPDVAPDIPPDADDAPF